MSLTCGQVLVLLPVHNCAETIHDTVNSILNQSYHNFILYISYDLSTDRTYELLSKITDNRVILDSRIGPPGLFSNMNHCINFARSFLSAEFVCIYNSDDIYSLTILEEQVKAFRFRPYLSAVFTESIFIDIYGSTIGFSKNSFTSQGTHVYTFEQMFKGSLHSTVTCLSPSFMTKVSCLVNNPNLFQRPDLFGQAADFGFYLELARLEGPVHVIPLPLLKYRIWSKSSSSSIYKDLPDNHKLLNYFFDDDLISSSLTRLDLSQRNIHLFRFELCRARQYSESNHDVAAHHLSNTCSISFSTLFNSLYNFRVVIEHFLVRAFRCNKYLLFFFFRLRSIIRPYFLQYYRLKRNPFKTPV